MSQRRSPIGAPQSGHGLSCWLMRPPRTMSEWRASRSKSRNSRSISSKSQFVGDAEQRRQLGRLRSSTCHHTSGGNCPVLSDRVFPTQEISGRRVVHVAQFGQGMAAAITFADVDQSRPSLRIVFRAPYRVHTKREPGSAGTTRPSRDVSLPRRKPNRQTHWENRRDAADYA
jgi:hypothetical protein